MRLHHPLSLLRILQAACPPAALLRRRSGHHNACATTCDLSRPCPPPGKIEPVNPDVKFDSVAPASTFSNSEFANLFFKTKQ